MTGNDIPAFTSEQGCVSGSAHSRPRSSNSPPIKRRRLRACDGCRHRKIRCDDTAGSCRNCQVYHAECVITRDGVVTTRSNREVVHRPDSRPNGSSSIPRKRSTKAMEKQSTKIHGTSHVQFHGEHKSSNRRALTSPSENNTSAFLYQIPAEAPSQAGHYSSQDTANATPSQPSISATSSHQSVQLQGVVMIGPGRFPRKSKYAGMSSGQVLAKSAEELFKEQAPQVDVMKFFCPLMSFAEENSVVSIISKPLVGKVIADRAVRKYFSSFHLLFPVLDVNSFKISYEEFYRLGHSEDVPQVACIFLVIALGSTEDDRNSHSAHSSAAWNLYHHLIATPYLSTVQALILLTLDLLNFHKDGQAILAVGAAIRTAQSLGLHRSLQAHTHPHEKDFIQKEHNLRNKIWWACYCLDKKLCFEGGRPSAINDDDCDTDMPAFETESPMSNPKHSFPFLVIFIELCKILSRVSQQLFSRGTSSQPEDEILARIAALDEDLLAWKQSLPSELQPDQELAGITDDMALVGTALLHCVYNNVLIVIHRAALLGEKSHEMKTHSNRRVAASDTICMNAARALAKLVNELVAEKPDMPLTRWTTGYLLTATFVLYVGNMKAPTKWSCATDLTLMQSMGSCLRKNKYDTKAMGNFNSLLDSLCAAVDIVRAKQQATSQKVFDSSNPAENALAQIATSSLGAYEATTGLALNCFPDQTIGLSNGLAGNSSIDDPNFNFGDFFGDGSNAFNMQFWPTVDWAVVGQAGLDENWDD